MTPESRPDMCAPGMAEADTEGDGATVSDGAPGAELCEARLGGGTSTAGCETGVEGLDEAGEGASTIHILFAV